MDTLTVIAAVVVAAVAGVAVGVRLPRQMEKQRVSKSHLIALGILFVDATSTYFVLYLCRLAIITRYEGALPYLTALIGALQAATAIVLSGYFYKSKAENTKGGITYDAAMKSPADGDL